LKYCSHTEDPVISIGGRNEPGEVRYFVRDQGPGIDPKYHEKIFGLFQRLETDQPGTGVGLASVAKILDMHGGRVWVDSAIDRGATFWVAFPNPPRRGTLSNDSWSG
jgi:signal transduction histidine kinase